MKGIPRCETRSEVVIRCDEQMRHALRISEETLAQQVAEHFHAHVSADKRAQIGLEFADHGDPYACAKANAQKLRRFRNGDVRLPSDLEESWVESLAEPYRSDCKRELARRYGFLDVPLPDVGHLRDVESLARLTQDFAQVLAAMSPILDDGKITHADGPHLETAICCLQSNVAAAHGLLARLERAKLKLNAAHKAGAPALKAVHA